MIELPPGFDAALLFTDLFAVSAPFVGIGFMIAAGFLVINVFKQVA